MSEPLNSPNPQIIPPPHKSVKVASTVVIVATVIVNLFLICSAWADKSWGALGIALIFGPAANGIILVCSMIGIPVVRTLAEGSSVAPYVLTGICSPLIAIAIDWAAIFAMPLHGC
jgi:hypothetical protein